LPGTWEALEWSEGRLPGFWLGWPWLPGFWLGWLPLPGFWLGWPQFPGFWLGRLPLPGFWLGWPQLPGFRPDWPPLPGLPEPFGWLPLGDVSLDWFGLSVGDSDGRLLAAGACGPATHVTTDEAPAAARAAPAVIKSATTTNIAPA
jgi:hypothetical protein